MRITLIDYGATNLPSVEHAFQQLGATTERATTPEQIAAATALVLPGVGRFGAMMRALEVHQLRSATSEALGRKVPFFGIGLGLHALYEGSDESPEHPGFAILPGRVVALPLTVRLPHMGWRQLQRARDGKLLRGISEKAWFYFAHTFAIPAGSADAPHGSGRVLEMRPANTPPPEPPLGAVALCTHGLPFVAVMESGHVSGVQFHPEKSGRAGMCVLRRFLEAAR